LALKTEFPKDPNQPLELTTVAQYYHFVSGRGTLNQELHEIFSCNSTSTPLHTLLAQLPIPLLIITTNYDDLLECAFTAEQRPFDVVVHTTDPQIGTQLLWWEYGASEPKQVNPNDSDIRLDQKTVIYKMHGAIDRDSPKRAQFVITEDDYIEFLTRMTKSAAIPSVFADPFKNRHFLFLGHGLRDWNLRVVLNQIDKDPHWSKSLVSWSIQHPLSLLEREFWKRRNVLAYDMLIDEFVQELQTR